MRFSFAFFGDFERYREILRQLPMANREGSIASPNVLQLGGTLTT